MVHCRDYQSKAKKVILNYCIVIPARFGIQRVHEKNLRQVHGRTLIHRTLVHALTANLPESRICLTTNKPQKLLTGIDVSLISSSGLIGVDVSKEINQGTRGVDLHYRNDLLSTEFSPIIETVRLIQNLYAKIGTTFRQWIIMQPTSPFRGKREIIEFSRKCATGLTDLNFSLVSVSHVQGNHPARMYRIEGEHLNSISNSPHSEFARRQDLESLYLRDGGFYVTSSQNLGMNMIIGKFPKFIVREFPWTTNIDTEYDLELAQGMPEHSVLDDPNSLPFTGHQIRSDKEF